jgi:hypothetical protein
MSRTALKEDFSTGCWNAACQKTSEKPASYEQTQLETKKNRCRSATSKSASFVAMQISPDRIGGDQTGFGICCVKAISGTGNVSLSAPPIKNSLLSLHFRQRFADSYPS